MYTITSWLLVACLLAAGQVRANVKAVFAHFMVGNTGSYSVADWEDDISKATAAHIDGFVLNIAVGEATNGASLGNAFTAANNLGSAFKLLFSFDYAGNGLWDKEDVISLITRYSSNPAYYHRGSQPLVSTFEGPAASDDWPSIKAATDCFFIPSWSSLGAAPAWAKGTADGLFSWAAWPEGPNSRSTFTDHSYLDALGGAPYMMGVSPWFYTNMPGYRKNWLWRGDTLWFDRWVHVMYLQPEYVQIISWNDYGESHHIGPLRDKAYVAFDGAHGRAPFNYALDKPHDGWRTFLPFLIDMAKSNTTSFNQENVVAWYRETPNSVCGTGGTTGNTASQLQQTYPPAVLAQDRVFYAALLGSPASVSVSIGGQSVAGTWDITPSGGVGLYRGSVPMGGRTGDVVVTITRSGSQISQASGNPITTACTHGMENWNANVITGNPRTIASVSPLSLTNSVCTSGVGDPKYLDLCSFACKYGYCPPVCTCTSLGAAAEKPAAQNVNGCPKPGLDSTYLGLCSFGCNYGYCPPSLCQVYPADHVCTAPNPTAPPIPVCVSGMADGPYADLCSFSCYYGFCPPEICTCTEAGSAGPAPPPLTGMVGGPVGAIDHGLCQWACQHGNCPSHLCTCSGSGCPSAAAPGTFPGGLFFEFPTKLAVTQSLSGQLMGGINEGSKYEARYLGDEPQCHLASDCTDQGDSYDSQCGISEVWLGWDKDGCTGHNKGRSICCPISQNARKCTWRGGGLDCNGQCHAGEVQLWQSRWGNQGKRCNRGTKSFCCQAPGYALVTRGCEWSGCWGRCDSKTQTSVLTQTTGNWPVCYRQSDYCCPKSPYLHSCVWRGSAPDCAEAKCKDDEITIALDGRGDTEKRCLWGRQKVACCKVDAPPPTIRMNLCSFDWCSAFPLECSLEDGEGIDDVEPEPAGRTLTKRGGARPISSRLTSLSPFSARSYPSRGVFIKTMLKKTGSVAWWGVSEICGSAAVKKHTATSEASVPAALDTEHPVDLQLLMRFAESCVTGKLPGGGKSIFDKIPASYFNNIFSRESMLPRGLPRVTPTSPEILSPMKRVYEVFGSNTNLAPFFLADKQMNQIKGAVMGGAVAINANSFKKLIELAVGGDDLAAKKAFSYIKGTIAVFYYLQQPEVSSVFKATAAGIGAQLAIVEKNTLGAPNLAYKWYEYFGALTATIPWDVQEWLRERINVGTDAYKQHLPPNYQDVADIFLSYYLEVNNVYIPGIGKEGMTG